MTDFKIEDGNIVIESKPYKYSIFVKTEGGKVGGTFDTVRWDKEDEKYMVKNGVDPVAEFDINEVPDGIASALKILEEEL